MQAYFIIGIIIILYRVPVVNLNTYYRFLMLLLLAFDIYFIFYTQC